MNRCELQIKIDAAKQNVERIEKIKKEVYILSKKLNVEDGYKLNKLLEETINLTSETAVNSYLAIKETMRLSEPILDAIKNR